VDDSVARNMPGVRDIFTIKTYNEGQEKSAFDNSAFTELAVVVGNSTWEVMNAKKALTVAWEPIGASTSEMDLFNRKVTVHTPSGFESTKKHKSKMAKLGAKPGKVLRKDGNPEEAFKRAAKIIERHYSAPFLAHNTMEPMNFFAHVTEDKAELVGPIQTPEIMEKSVAARLGLPLEKVVLNMDRYGNTSAASIPIALDEAVRDGRVKDGQLVMFGAFGAGLTWASTLLRW